MLCVDLASAPLIVSSVIIIYFVYLLHRVCDCLCLLRVTEEYGVTGALECRERTSSLRSRLPGGNHCKKAIWQFSSYVTEGKDGHRVL